MIGLLEAIQLIKQFYTAEVQALLNGTAEPQITDLCNEIFKRNLS